MNVLWYYASEGQTVGPMSLASLMQVLSRMSDAGGTLVWRDGFENWEKASRVSELAPYGVKPPPLPAPPPPLPRKIDSGFSEPTITAEESRLLAPSTGPVGIGGWLILVALSRIYGPLGFLVWMANYYSTLDNSLWTTFPFTAYSEAALNAAFFLLSIWTTILFFRKSKSFPLFFIYSCVASVLLMPVDLVLVTFAGQTIQEAISAVTNKEAAQWGQSLVGALVWIPYIRMSKRVANTFVY